MNYSNFMIISKSSMRSMIKSTVQSERKIAHIDFMKEMAAAFATSRDTTVFRFYKCQRQAFVTIEHLFQALQRCPSNRCSPAEARP